MSLQDQPSTHGPLDLPGLEPVGELAQRQDGGEALGRIARDRLFLGGYECHLSTVVDMPIVCQPRLLHTASGRGSSGGCQRFSFPPRRRYRLPRIMRRSLLVALLALCWLVPAATASADATSDGDDRIVLVGSVLVDRDETAGDVWVGRRRRDGPRHGDRRRRRRRRRRDDPRHGRGQRRHARRPWPRSAGAAASRATSSTPTRSPSRRRARRSAGTSRSSTSATPASSARSRGSSAITVSMFLLGLILLLLAPRAADAVARTAKAKALVSFGVGFLGVLPDPDHRGRRVLHGRRHPARASSCCCCSCRCTRSPTSRRRSRSGGGSSRARGSSRSSSASSSSGCSR